MGLPLPSLFISRSSIQLFSRRVLMAMLTSGCLRSEPISISLDEASSTLARKVINVATFLGYAQRPEGFHKLHVLMVEGSR